MQHFIQDSSSGSEVHIPAHKRHQSTLTFLLLANSFAASILMTRLAEASVLTVTPLDKIHHLRKNLFLFTENKYHI